MQQPIKTRIGDQNTPPLIELKKTCFSVNIDKRIINNITTNIFTGDFIVVLGGNGSGKSTLLKLINRTYRHSSGKIIFKNKPIENYDNKSLKKSVVTITQNISDSLFVDLTIEENSKLIDSPNAIHYEANGNGSASDRLSDYVSQFNPTLAMNLNTKVSTLSGG